MVSSCLHGVFASPLAQFDLARQAVNCIDTFIRLDPQVVDAGRVMANQKKIRDGKARLGLILGRLLGHPYFADYVFNGFTDKPEHAMRMMNGDEQIWGQVIWLLLKNAAEASGTAR